MSHCIHSFHYLKNAFFEIPSMSDSDNYREKMLQFASHNPVKFVALVSVAVTGAIPVVCFLLYAVGTVLCTLVAAVVLDIALLSVGVFGLALALCFAGCFAACVAGVFSVVFLGYKTARVGWSKPRGHLVPSTVTATARSSPIPTDSQTQPIDKNK